MESETSSPDLLCEEDNSSINSSQRIKKDGCLELCCSVSESDCEFIEMLLQREAGVRPNGDGNLDELNEGIWLKRRRLDAIKWMLETRELFGYKRRTAYLAVIYFDRFFTRRRITDKLWLVPLLSIACLSLAAKMEECEVKALREYSVEGYEFSGNTIQRMELFVLNALEWKMNSATPFTYLNYFITKFCGESRNKEFAIQVSELILAIMEEINVVEYQPSIIAAAAVLASYDCQLSKATMENKMAAVPSWGSLEKEHMFSCYSILQEFLMPKAPTSLVSHIATDNSTITSRNGAKRRLAFGDDGDQQHPVQKLSKSP